MSFSKLKKPIGFKTLGRWLYEEKEMSKRRYTKMIHEGKYVAEVEVEMICHTPLA